MVPSFGKHVLITFGRSFLTLNLARLMAAGGHRVTIVDSIPVTITRFSDSVQDFHLVSPPKFAPQEYCRELASIVVDESVDMVIPIHEETDILSMMRGLFPPECSLFLSDFDLENQLHNKFEYCELMRSLGIPTLRYAQMEGPEDAGKLSFDGPFAVKRCYSRGSQKVHKVYPGDTMEWLDHEPANPWLAQEWMSGSPYCTYSVCHEGRVYAHATYPVDYAIGGSSCLTFTAVRHQKIFDWVSAFVAEVGFTGQIGFDFIENPAGDLYSIECNPRSTSGIMMFRPDNHVERAFFAENDDVIQPDTDMTRMIGIGMALYGWRKSSRNGKPLRQFFRDFATFSDVIAEKGDEKPAAMLLPSYAWILRSSMRYHVGLAEGFMHDHEWDGRPIDG